MNSKKFKPNGLSARRKVIDKIKSGSLWAFMLVIGLIAFSCNQKNNDQKLAGSKEDQAVATQDSVSKPKVNIKVNKRYDDKGNLVGFDSTYSTFYSNVEGDTPRMDSLLNSFNRYFNRNHSSFLDDEFNKLFFNDSLRYQDYFHHDFFEKRYELNDDYFKGMMQRMDSIKNQFYRQHGGKNHNGVDL